MKTNIAERATAKNGTPKPSPKFPKPARPAKVVQVFRR